MHRHDIVSSHLADEQRKRTKSELQFVTFERNDRKYLIDSSC